MDTAAQLNAALAGRYDIDREIGAGGMATVFLARDVKHQRPVALKVLDPQLGAMLGVERFLSEIQVTAHLQHPNLLPLFDSGEADGLLFYVMPFVEGESLRARLEREKQLPVSEAVRLAIAICGALDYAHRHGVIHRDLKPENILLHEGQPLLADFGIALAVKNAGGNRITQTGLSLGTPAYMSPEQATGDRVIDGRTDVYSLGAVLYEMLTGDPPHAASTAQAIIAKVLTEKPRSVRATRDTVPAYVDAAIERALAKLPADRWPTAQAFSDALSGTARVSLPKDVVTPGSVEHDVARVERVGFGWRGVLPWAVAAAAVAVAAVMWWRPRVVEPSYQFELVQPDTAPLAGGAGPIVAMSPDGQTAAMFVAMPSGRALLLRRLDELAPRVLAYPEGAIRPGFSPDGAWVTYVARTTLEKIPITGGSPLKMIDSVNAYSWGDDGVIAYTRTSPDDHALWLEKADGGAPERLVAPDTARGEIAFQWPLMLPGSHALLAALFKRGGLSTGEIVAVDLATHHVTRLGLSGTSPRYIAGTLLFAQPDGALLAAPFDPKRLRVLGAPVPLLANVYVKNGGAAEFAVSAQGTMLYVPMTDDRQLVSVDRLGRSTALMDKQPPLGEPRLSPDGSKIAVTIRHGARIDVWIFDRTAQTLSPLTTDGSSSGQQWLPDGRRVAYINTSTGRPRLMSRAWDGSDSIISPIHVKQPRGFAFVPGTTRIVVSDLGANYGDLFLEDFAAPGPVQPIVIAQGNQLAPAVSPDGKWLAYASDESGRYQIYVRPLSGSGAREQVSVDGGTEPVWARSGGEIFYRANGMCMSATVTTTGGFRVVHRDSLFPDHYASANVTAGYDVSKDGKSLLMAAMHGGLTRAVVALHWDRVVHDRLAANAGGDAK